MTMYRWLLCALCAAGCAAETIGDAPPEAPLDELFIHPGMETQGQHLLGKKLDNLDIASAAHVSFSNEGTLGGEAVTVSLVAAADLQAVELDGTVHPHANGVSLSASDGGTLVATALATSSGITGYSLAYTSPGGVASDPCDGNMAFPFAGVFWRDGLHEAVDAISFACDLDGVAAKCTTWGYPAGPIEEQPEWDAHQACTRMARGDGCASGTTHTREETYIAFFDTFDHTEDISEPPPVFAGLSAWPPPPDLYDFEAVYRPGQLPAVCMSKLRWNALPFGGPDDCMGVLPDPREEEMAAFCDDYPGGVEQMENDGGVLFVMSKYTDLRMDRWIKGSDRLWTVRGYHTDPASLVPETAPYPGYVYDGEGPLLLRSLPGSVAPGEVVDVDMYFHPATLDRVVALKSAPPSGYVDKGFEGKVFKKQKTGTVALRLYKLGNDLVSATARPTPAYVDIGFIGYVTAD
jgi:hypothetical protein